MNRIYQFIRWCFVFAKALTMANIDVAKKVLAKEINFRPGFLAISMKASSDFEITSLANAITLTPGTITVHVDREREQIIIHAIDVGDDPDAVRRDVQETLEANILSWTRPSRSDA